MKSPFIWAGMTDVEDEKKTGLFQKEKEERRLLQGKGIITRHSADDVVKKLLSQKPSDDMTVIFDFNHGTKYGEPLKKHGYRGIFAQEWAYDLERKREKAGEMVKKYYKDVKVPRQVKFGTNSADKIKQFIEKDPLTVWVVKPNAEGMWVFCPKSEEGPIAMQENLNHIDANREAINAIPMVLQEKVIGTEINIETGYCDGKPVYCAIDLENKFMETEEMGHQSGCAFDLVKFVPLDCELRRMCNQPFDRLAEKLNFTGLMDMNAIISNADGKPYFIEFCPNRFGYDALMTEIECYGKGVDTYLKDLTQGTMNPPLDRFAASVKVFNRDHHEDFISSIFDKEYEHVKFQFQGDQDGVWLWDVWKDGNDYRLAHYCDDAAVVTASSDTAQGAIEKAKLKAERSLEFDGKYFRGDVDSYTRTYNPAYRYEYLRDRRLLENRD